MTRDNGAFPAHIAELSADRSALLRGIYGVPDGVPGSDLVRWFSHPQTVQPVVLALNTFEHQVLEAVLVHPPGRSRADIDAVIDGRATPAQVDAALERLDTLALAWPIARKRWAANPGLPLVLPMPCGLGPGAAELLPLASLAQLQHCMRAFSQPIEGRKASLVEALVHLMGDPEAVAQMLARLPRSTRETLETLCALGDALRTGWGYPHPPGTDELIDLALVVVRDYSFGLVPRELSVAVRGGRVLLSVDPDPPEVGAPFAGSLSGAAESAAAGAVADLQSLLSAIETTPPPQLASGGIGTREFRRLAKLVGVTESQAAVLLLLAEFSEQLATDGGTVTATPAARAFGEAPAARQWQQLVEAWFRSPTTSASTPYLGPPARREVRELAPTTLLRVLRPDRVLATPDILCALKWWSPGVSLDLLAGDLDATLAEAALLGLAIDGTLTPLGAATLVDPGVAATALADRLPSTVHEVILQGDLTATSTGPPAPELARLLDGAADRETRGHAVVWRFSATSIRRYLDTGVGGADLLAALTQAAPRGVPNAVRALIDDAARRQGEVSVHTALTVLVARDPAIAATLLHDRRLAKLQLAGVAPTVLISPSEEAAVLDLVRKSGFSPAAVRSGPPVVSADLDKLVRTAVKGPRTLSTSLLKVVRGGHEATLEFWQTGDVTTVRLRDIRVDSTYVSGVAVSDGAARRYRLGSLYSVTP